MKSTLYSLFASIGIACLLTQGNLAAQIPQSALDAQKVEVPEEATIKKVAQEVSLLIKNTFQPASGGFGVASGWVVS